MHTHPPRNFTPEDVARARRNAAAAGRSYIDWDDFEADERPTPPIPPHATALPIPPHNQPLPPPTGAKRCQSAPNSAKRCHPHEKCKTNPPSPHLPSAILHPSSSPTPARPPRALTPDQLRAARLPVAGRSTNDIAAALALNRHTIAKWKRRPAFQAELHRLLDPPRQGQLDDFAPG